MTMPWICLVIGMLDAITNSLTMTAVSSYVVSLTSLETVASIQGILSCIYHGVGTGAGAFLGGVLVESYGYRITLQIFGCSSFAIAVLYALLNLFYLQKRALIKINLDGSKSESASCQQCGKV